MNASEGRLRSVAEGEVESVDGVLVIRRIHVAYELRLDADGDSGAVGRVHEMHANYCPVYRSLHPQIEITTSLEVVSD